MSHAGMFFARQRGGGECALDRCKVRPGEYSTNPPSAGVGLYQTMDFPFGSTTRLSPACLGGKELRPENNIFFLSVGWYWAVQLPPGLPLAASFHLWPCGFVAELR